MADEPGKRKVTFNLSDGTHVVLDLSNEDLKAAMQAIENDGYIGSLNLDVPQQLFILAKHVVSLSYEVHDRSSEWGNP